MEKLNNKNIDILKTTGHHSWNPGFKTGFHNYTLSKVLGTVLQYVQCTLYSVQGYSVQCIDVQGYSVQGYSVQCIDVQGYLERKPNWNKLSYWALAH